MKYTYHAQANKALQQAYATFPTEEARALRWSAHFYEKILECLLERYPSFAGRTMVDAGTGRGLLPLAMRFLGAEVYALEKYVFDFSESDMFREGDEQALLQRWQTQGVRPLVKDVYELSASLPAASCDAVTSSHVIEHLKAPKRFLDQCFEVLKPGGFVVVLTPNYARLHARLRLFIGKNPKMDLEPFYLRGEQGFVGHWREYLPDELETMLRLSGFESVTSDTFCDPWYDVQKEVTLRALGQMSLHLVSQVLPRAQWNLFAIGRKPLGKGLESV